MTDRNIAKQIFLLYLYELQKIVEIEFCYITKSFDPHFLFCEKKLYYSKITEWKKKKKYGV